MTGLGPSGRTRSEELILSSGQRTSFLELEYSIRTPSSRAIRMSGFQSRKDWRPWDLRESMARETAGSFTLAEGAFDLIGAPAGAGDTTPAFAGAGGAGLPAGTALTGTRSPIRKIRVASRAGLLGRRVVPVSSFAGGMF